MNIIHLENYANMRIIIKMYKIMYCLKLIYLIHFEINYYTFHRFILHVLLIRAVIIIKYERNKKHKHKRDLKELNYN